MATCIPQDGAHQQRCENLKSKSITRLHFEIGGTTFGTTAFCLGQLLALAGEEPSRAGGRICYAGWHEEVVFVLFLLSFRYSFHCTNDSFLAI